MTLSKLFLVNDKNAAFSKLINDTTDSSSKNDEFKIRFSNLSRNRVWRDELFFEMFYTFFCFRYQKRYRRFFLRWRFIIFFSFFFWFFFKQSLFQWKPLHHLHDRESVGRFFDVDEKIFLNTIILIFLIRMKTKSFLINFFKNLSIRSTKRISRFLFQKKIFHNF